MQINNQSLYNSYRQATLSKNSTQNTSANNYRAVQNRTENHVATGAREVQLFLPDEDTIYSGTAGNLSFELKYSENSTEENPIIIASGADENGNPFKQEIIVNNIDPRNATGVEFRALEAHMNGGKGPTIDTASGSLFSSGAVGLMHETGNTGSFNPGLNDRNNYIDILSEKVNFYSQSPHLSLQHSGIEFRQLMDDFMSYMGSK